MEDKELMAGVMWEAPKYVPYDNMSPMI